MKVMRINIYLRHLQKNKQEEKYTDKTIMLYKI